MGYIGAGITRFNTADELTVTGDAQIDTTTLVVDSTNNRVGMGTASPDGTTHIHTASAGSVTANTDADDLTVENSGNSGISILSPDANRSAIMLGHASDNLKMQIRHDGSTSLSQIISDDAVTFNVIGGTERMRINDTGVGIGESSPTRNLVIKDTDGQVDIGLVTSNTGVSALMFADTDDSNIGRIQYLHSTNDLTFTTNDSEAVRIDSSGNLLVGTTDTDTQNNNAGSAADNGLVYNKGSGGYLNVARYGGTVAYFNRTSTDGAIVDFRKDGTTVGSIGSRDSSTSYIILKTSSGAGAGLTGSDNRILPMDESALADANTDLGMSSYRFKDLYLSGGAYLGGTGSANKLDDYEEGTWTPASTGTATYTEQYGRYRKVGDVVYIMLRLEINSIGNGEQTRINGLPFAAARECTIHASKFENINLSIVDGTLRTSGTFLYLTHRTAASTSSTSNSAFLTNNTVVQASGWYHTSD